MTTPPTHPEKAIREALPVVAWTERQTMAAINATGSHGAVTLTYEHGPYDISRPSFKCDRLVEHIVAFRDAQWLAHLSDLRAEVERLTKERDDARRAKTAHFSPAYLLSNARRIAAPEYATMSNWALATHIFAVGSTTANTICRENGVDPDSKTVHPGAAIDAAQAGAGGAG